jgi:ribonuclease-3
MLSFVKPFTKFYFMSKGETNNNKSISLGSFYNNSVNCSSVDDSFLLKSDLNNSLDIDKLNKTTFSNSKDQKNSLNKVTNVATNSGLRKKSQNHPISQEESLRLAENTIGYSFKNILILREALTHPSLKRIDSSVKHYQRLEFLGDKILGFVMAEYLFNTLQNEDEGILSKKQALLVSGNVCYQIAVDIGLEKFLIMSKSQDKDGGRNNKKILQNITESIIGAIYKDSQDINLVKNFILRVWDGNLKMSQRNLDFKDPKTTLQEWFQQRTKNVPEYKTETFLNGTTSYFEVSLVIKDIAEVRVVDTNRKNATKLVAAKMLKIMHEKGFI